MTSAGVPSADNGENPTLEREKREHQEMVADAERNEREGLNAAGEAAPLSSVVG